MDKTVNATEARIRFGELMREAQKSPITVVRDGKAEVVIISKKAYDRLVNNLQPRGWRELVAVTRERIAVDLASRALPMPDDLLFEMREDRDEQSDYLY
ncbi:MAG: type II toxin-antitoxin system prevent-host-death family antitoxin [Anaerolineaceae bacterium]